MAHDPFSLSSAPGFDDPIGVLRACHRRIERQLATLDRLVHHLPVHHADAEARAAATAVMRYFDIAAVHHHADEEQSLFPRLATGAPAALILAQELARQHVDLGARWLRLRPLLSAIVAGSSAYLPVKGVEEFRTVYAAHIALEEGELLPQAGAMLTQEDLAEVGAEMAARRGLAK